MIGKGKPTPLLHQQASAQDVALYVRQWVRYIFERGASEHHYQLPEELKHDLFTMRAELRKVVGANHHSGTHQGLDLEIQMKRSDANLETISRISSETPTDEFDALPFEESD